MSGIDNTECKILRLNEKLMKVQKNHLLRLMYELNPNHEQSYYQGKSRDMEKFIADGSAIIYIALVHNEGIGYIWGYVRNAHVHVTQFVVDEKHRNLGVGNELMQKIIEWSCKNGISGVELNVLAHNYRGLKFYLKKGFHCENLFMIKKNITTEDDYKLSGGGYSYAFD